jgi:hypothetical protein
MQGKIITKVGKNVEIKEYLTEDKTLEIETLDAKEFHIVFRHDYGVGTSIDMSLDLTEEGIDELFRKIRVLVEKAKTEYKKI